MSDGLGRWALNELSDSAIQQSLGLKSVVSVDGVESALKRADTNTKPIQLDICISIPRVCGEPKTALHIL